MTNEAMEILRKFNAPKGAVLDKVFKNGNIQIKRRMECDRCNSGHGTYIIGVCNGKPVPSFLDGGVCWKCLGSGWVMGKEILRTPENEAKHQKELQKRKEAWELEQKMHAEQARALEEAKRREEERIEAERKAEEARLEALKAISQYVGQEGDKLEVEATYLYTATFQIGEGWMRETKHVHNFADANGNKLVWFTGTWPFDAEEGEKVILKGTIKGHKEYKGEKQTNLIRCKVSKA